MRASFGGLLAIAQVVVGIKAYPVVSDQEQTRLVWTHRPCLAPLNTAKTCSLCRMAVEKDDQVRAMLHDGAWVPVEEEDLERLFPPERGAMPRVLRVLQFAEARQILADWTDKAYYLVPEPGHDRAYAAVAAALRRTTLVGIVQFVAYQRMRYACVSADPNGLVLRTLQYADAVRTIDDYNIGIAPTQPAPQEVSLMTTLVRRLRGPAWQLQPNPFQAQLRGLVEDKHRQRPIRAAFAAAQPARMANLVDALKASLASARVRKAQKGQKVPAK